MLPCLCQLSQARGAALFWVTQSLGHEVMALSSWLRIMVTSLWILELFNRTGNLRWSEFFNLRGVLMEAGTLGMCVEMGELQVLAPGRVRLGQC